MKKYFLKNDAGDQEGPFSPEELVAKGVGPDTPVWYDGLESWTTISEVEDLKAAFSATPANTSPMDEPNTASTVTAAVPETAANPEPVAEPVVAAAAPPVAAAPAAAATAAPATAAVKVAKAKGNPVITWVLSLLVLGGTGYYVYQDMEKNKDTKYLTGNEAPVTDDTTVVISDEPPMTTDDKKDPEIATEVTDTITMPENKERVVTTVPDNQSGLNNKTEEEKKQAAAAKKKEEEKKKQLAAEAKKKEEEKKKLLAAQALAAKEMEMRNSWARYVTLGSFTTEGDDKVKPFAIPVYNGFNVAVDKVTLRVDYLKKEKIVGTETLVLGTIPAKSGSSIQATGNKKGKKANVYIIGVSSRALHFCYPSTGGKPGDQYYCN